MIVECVKKVVVDQGFELGFHAWESGLVTIIPQSVACGRGDKYLIVCCWERERTMIMNMARKEIAYRSCRDFFELMNTIFLFVVRHERWWWRESCIYRLSRRTIIKDDRLWEMKRLRYYFDIYFDGSLLLSFVLKDIRSFMLKKLYDQFTNNNLHSVSFMRNDG